MRKAAWDEFGKIGNTVIESVSQSLEQLELSAFSSGFPFHLSDFSLSNALVSCVLIGVDPFPSFPRRAFPSILLPCGKTDS